MYLFVLVLLIYKNNYLSILPSKNQLLDII